MPILEMLLRCARARGVRFAHERPDAVNVIRAVKAIPYGRATDRRPTTLLEEWRGTCSGKHYLLAAALSELGLGVGLIHRVYRLRREDAATMFPAACAAVPAHGLTDVHTYASVPLVGRLTVVDVTFPGSWDGRSDMPLACGPGLDVTVPPGVDPQELKEALILKHCIPEEREPFIAALSDSDPAEKPHRAVQP